MVSIIIPNHNKGAFIKASLQSIKLQTFTDWEAIIVDDGSTDNSISIAESFGKQDARYQLIKLPKQQNGGSVCRNLGLQKAKGDFVLFFDSDDVLGPTCLEKRIEFMHEHPQAAFAVFTMQTFLNYPGDQDYLWIPRKNEALNRFLMHDLPWQTMQPLYKKDFLINNKLFFDEQFPRMQDVEFHTSVLLKQPKFEIFNGEPDCYFRVNPNRKVFNARQFYVQWVKSANLFVKKFGKQNQMLLGHTILMSTSEIIAAKNNRELNFKEAKSILSKIESGLNNRCKLILVLYKWLGLLFPFHVKGLRRIFSSIIKFFLDPRHEQ